MDISKLGNWLQVGANVGILAGLILVSIQISENTRISKVELTARSFEIAMQHDLTKMGENPPARRPTSGMPHASFLAEDYGFESHGSLEWCA